MVRLAVLPPDFAEALRRIPMPAFEPAPWITPPPLSEARVALVSTAGIHRASDRPFDAGATDYRIIPDDVAAADMQMSHVSVNFDRSGFQQDVNTIFPLELLHELAASGEIGSVARWHYSLMGATDPSEMQQSAEAIGRLLNGDGVTAALLAPV